MNKILALAKPVLIVVAGISVYNLIKRFVPVVP